MGQVGILLVGCWFGVYAGRLATNPGDLQWLNYRKDNGRRLLHLVAGPSPAMTVHAGRCRYVLGSGSGSPAKKRRGLSSSMAKISLSLSPRWRSIGMKSVNR